MQEGARAIARAPASTARFHRLVESLGLNRPELRAWVM